jgi:exonuclease SbcD
MKILHTADWHLGRFLGAHELLGLQSRAIDDIVGIAGEERPDAIVIAGDLYDRSVPSEDSMRVFEMAIVRLREIAPVLAIAGNHDGAGRVGHFASVLKESGIHVASSDFGPVKNVRIRDRDGDVMFHLMPFAMPIEVRHALGDRVAEVDPSTLSTHHGATAARLSTIDRSLGTRHVLVAHLFTQSGGGAEESESERDISVGGSSIVSASLFEGFHYVALGHLHKPHDVIPGRVRYAGSIGRYSFSEESHEKSVSIVEIGIDGSTVVRQVPIPCSIAMRTISGSFMSILQSATNDEASRTAFVRIRLDDAVPQFEAFRRLREHYPRLVEMTYDRTAASLNTSPALERPERRDPMEMVRAFCRDRLGTAVLSEEAMALAQELMEEARETRGILEES